MVTLALTGCLFQARSFAKPADGLLVRALTCQLRDDEISGFQAALTKVDPGFATPAQRYAAPSYNQYKSGRAVSAYGYTTDDIVLAPGRVVLLAPAADRGKVEKSLGLQHGDLFPSAKDVGRGRSIVAYEMHSAGMKGKLLLGCQYAVPEASFWGSD